MKIHISRFLLYVMAILLSAIVVYPMLWTLCGSINTASQIARISIIPQGVTFKHYYKILTDSSFGVYIQNTLIYATSVTIIQLLLNSMAAYAFARLRFWGKNFFFIFILATMMIPFSVTMVPLYILIKSFGLINSLLALILPSMASGNGIFLLRQFYSTIPVELEEAGRIDGLSRFGCYLRIIVPLSKPIMLSQGLFTFLACWNNYLWPAIVNVKEKYWVLTVGIQSFQALNVTNWNGLLTGAAVSMIPTIILFFLFQKQLVDGIKTTGMKM